MWDVETGQIVSYFDQIKHSGDEQVSNYGNS
jgi:hypothetical protein